jgi:two-component system OmpR family sensor kinase
MSIRTRLTIWYTAILTFILGVFGTGIYFYVTWQTIQNLDSRLAQSAEAALNLALTRRPIFEQRDGRQILRLQGLDVLRASQIYVQLIGPSGLILATSPNITDEFLNLPLDPRALNATMRSNDGSAIFSESQHRGAPPIRVFTKALITNSGEVVGYIQVATSLEELKTAQNNLLFALSIMGGSGILFSAIVGAWMARRALRPVDELTKTAMAIYRAENLEKRVTVPKANDEVSRLSRAFNEMLERLSLLFRAQQRLIADVSHELRTPLTVIRGNVDLLRMGGCCDKELLDAITEETDRMTRMVKNLSLLSQMDAGVLQLNLKQINVQQLLASILRSAQIISAGKVSVSAMSEPDLTIEADPDQTKQVLLNLVENAIKYTPEGGEVKIEAVGNYGDHVRISVSDNGPGIPEKDLPHIFERFYRVDKSRSRALGGSGLGLSIAQSIVQAHHGQITVRSKEGVGTTFDVYLPVKQPVEASNNGNTSA